MHENEIKNKIQMIMMHNFVNDQINESNYFTDYLLFKFERLALRGSPRKSQKVTNLLQNLVNKGFLSLYQNAG